MRGRIVNTATMRLALVMTAVMVFFLLQNYNPTTTTAVLSTFKNGISANNTIPASTIQVQSSGIKTPNTNPGVRKVNMNGRKSNTHDDKSMHLLKRKNDSPSDFHRAKSSRGDYIIQLMSDDGKDSVMDATITSLKVLLRQGTKFFADMVSGSDTSNNEKFGHMTQTYPQTNTKEPKKDVFNHHQHQTTAWKDNTTDESVLQSKQAILNANIAYNETAINSERKHSNNNSDTTKVPFHNPGFPQSQINVAPATTLKMCQVRMQVEGCKCERTIISRLPKCPGPNVTQQQLLNYINATLGESTCSDSATLRGANQSVRIG